MFSKTPEKCGNLSFRFRMISFSNMISMQATSKKTEVKRELLTNINKLSVVDKGVKRGIYNAIHRYYDKSKESSYLHILYGWEMSQKLSENNFEWIEDTSQSNEYFLKNYNKESNKGYFHEVDIQYLKNLHEIHNYFSFLSRGMKNEKVQKLVTSLLDKAEYIIHVKNLKQAINHALRFEKTFIE